MNILFVCTANQMRSATAAVIYADDKRFKVKSAGTAEEAVHTITTNDLSWADYVVVMEKEHLHHIQKQFPELYPQKVIFTLFISDIYQFMQPELIEELKNRFEYIYQARIIPTELAKEEELE